MENHRGLRPVRRPVVVRHHESRGQGGHERGKAWRGCRARSGHCRACCGPGIGGVRCQPRSIRPRPARPGGGPAWGSAAELAVGADDGQVGKIQARMVFGAEVDLQAADVEFLDAFQRRLQAFARGLGARAAQSLHQHLGGGQALEHGGAHFLAVRLRQVVRLAHERVVRRPFVREHLRDDDAACIRTQALGEPGRCVVGERDELRARTGRPEGRIAFGRRGSRRDHEHGLGLRLHELGRDGGEIGLGPVEALLQHGLELRGLEALERARQSVGAETVVGDDHRDPRDAHRSQVGDGFLGLALVGRAHVEDVAAHGAVEHHRARGGGHEGHIELVEQGDDGFRVRRAAREEHREHVLLLDELARVDERLGRVELVVERDEFDLLPVHAAPGVHRVNVELRALGGFLHARRDGPGEAGCLSHQQLAPGRRREQGSGREGQGGAGGLPGMGHDGGISG